MAGAPRFEVEIGASTADLKKGLQEARQELLKFQSEVAKGGRATVDFKNAMQAERLEGAKLTNQIKSTRLETAQLTLEKRKNTQVTTVAAGSYREAQQRLTALGKSIREAQNGFTAMTPAVSKNIAEYNRLNTQLKAFDARMGNFQRNVGNYPNAMGALSAVAPQISQLAGKGGGLIGVALAAADAAKTMVSFDAGLRNVEKTTGLSRKETQALGDDLINLSKSLKVVSAQGLTEYASTAGQLGVKGTQNILAFAESLAVLETASDIKGEEGAASIARLLTLTDGGVQNVKQFADEIVNLGNNFAATESEILGNASRIAQSTGTYKLGRQAVLAFATATKSVGAEAEVTGSAIGRTLGVLEGYSRSTDKSTALSRLLGISQQELGKRFKENASGVLVDFIGALNNVDKSGGSVNGTLESLGIKSIGIKQVIGSLATGGFDVLTDAMNKSKEAAEAAIKEFETQSTSLEKQIGRVNVAWENFTLTVDKGDGAFGRAIAGITGGLADVLDYFTEIEKTDGWKSLFGGLSPSGNPIVGGASLQQRYDPKKGFFGSLLGDVPFKSVSNNFAKDFWEPILGKVPSSVTTGARGLDVTGILGKNNNAYKYISKTIDDTTESTKNLVNAQLELGGDPTKTKGKSQADIIKEATEAITNGQIEAVRGVDGEMAKIDKKWDAILAKVNEISNVGLKKQQQGLVEVGREAEKYAKFLEIYGKGEEKLTRNLPTSLSGGNAATAPSILPLIERNQDRFRVQGKQNVSSYYSDAEELSKYMQRTLRNGLSNALNGVFESISDIGNKSIEIEQKYAELRANASADQIEALQKMERLEKRINNGLTSTLSNLVGSIGGLGSRTISSAVGEGFSSGNFDQLKNLFKGSNKAIGYASLASSLGGVISGASKSNAGKTFGSALSLAGSGAAIGTSIAPGIGTAIGAVAGAIVGAVSGILNSAEQRRQRELQNLQLLESKKQTALQNRIAALSYASSIIGQQSSMGVITSIDRNAYGDLVATINGQQIDLVLTRYKNSRG